MALRYFDGFDYASAAEMNTRGLVTSGGGQFYAGASPSRSSGTSTISQATFLTASDGYGYCNAANPFTYYQDNQSTWIVGFNWSTLPIGSVAAILTLKDVVTVQTQLVLYANATGFYVTLGTSSTILCDTGSIFSSGSGAVNSSTGLFPPWIFLEFKIVYHPTSGSVEIRSNGNTVAKVTGINTVVSGNNYANSCSFNLVMNNGPATLMDDLYICDGTGASNNDFLGACKVETNFPLADGTLNTWTPSSGSSGSAMVNEVGSDGDTSYVSSSTASQTDLFKFRAQFTGKTIGVQVVNVSRLDNYGF